MIGTVKRLITEEKISNECCPNCQELNTLIAKVYSNIFVLRILPFVYGKTTTVECTKCKKMYLNFYELPDKIKDKVIEIIKDAKHKWFTYIGYILIAFFYLLSLFTRK